MKTDAELAAIFDGYADTQVEWLEADLFNELYRALDDTLTHDAGNRDALLRHLHQVGDVAPRLPPVEKAVCRIVESCNTIARHALYVLEAAQRHSPKRKRAIRRAAEVIAQDLADHTLNQIKKELGLIETSREKPANVAALEVHELLTAAGLASKDAARLAGKVANRLVMEKEVTAEERKAAKERLERAKIAYQRSGETDLALKGTYQELLAQVRQMDRAAKPSSIESRASQRRKKR